MDAESRRRLEVAKREYPVGPKVDPAMLVYWAGQHGNWLMRELEAALAGVSFSDGRLLDWMEAFVKTQPLTLWDGEGEFPANRGVGLSFGKRRTLRQAIEQAAGPEPEPK